MSSHTFFQIKTVFVAPFFPPATTTFLRAFSPESAVRLFSLPSRPIRASQAAFSRPLAAPLRINIKNSIVEKRFFSSSSLFRLL